MFLTITNQDLMNTLNSMHNNSIWGNVLIACVPGIITAIFSYFILRLSNKHSEKQLGEQFEQERKKIKADRELQLKIEEKKFIDQKTIENLAEIASLLPYMFRKELMPDISDVYKYYKALEKSWGNIECYRSTALSAIKKSGTRERNRQLKCNILIAYAKKETREKYDNIVKEILWFSTIQLYYQYDVILEKKNENSNKSISKPEFINTKEKFDKDITELSLMIQDELTSYVDDLKNME